MFVLCFEIEEFGGVGHNNRNESIFIERLFFFVLFCCVLGGEPAGPGRTRGHEDTQTRGHAKARRNAPRGDTHTEHTRDERVFVVKTFLLNF